MAKYHKKPVIVDAIEYTGSNTKELSDFTGQNISALDSGEIFIRSKKGIQYAKPGDFIIKDINGTPYPCPRDVFLQTYEPA